MITGNEYFVNKFLQVIGTFSSYIDVKKITHSNLHISSNIYPFSISSLILDIYTFLDWSTWLF